MFLSSILYLNNPLGFNAVTKLNVNAVIKCVLLLSCLICSTAASALTLSSTVNRNTISTNETLQLTVTLDAQAEQSALDLTQLRADFEVLSVSPRNSQSISNINGKTTRVSTTRWVITLAAKRAGTLNIPSFTIKQARSNPISITALSPSQLGTNAQTKTAPLIAVGVADNPSIYPGQQLIYQIELSAAANVRDLSGTNLEIPGATVELLDQQNFQRIDNGVARIIVVLTFAIFVETSGEFTIPSITYTGLVGGQRTFFGNQGQQVVGRTNALTINVKEKPIATGQTWFPAEDVTISSTWSSDVNNISVGTPITRSVKVIAEGQLAAAIPPFQNNAVNNSAIKSYKDKPQLDSSKTNQGFRSTRIESEAIVINKAGDVVLPEMVIDWFNVNSGKWEQAVLAAETISATGAGNAIINQNLSPTTTATSNELLNPGLAGSGRWYSHWAWSVATAILSVICLCLSLLLIGRKRSSNQATKVSLTAPNESKSWNDLISAINNSQATQVRPLIIKWLCAFFPHIDAVNITTLHKTAHNDLLAALNKLDAELYSPKSSDNFEHYKEQLKRELTVYRKNNATHKSHKPGSNNHDLAPLYS